MGTIEAPGLEDLHQLKRRSKIEGGWLPEESESDFDL